MPSRTLTIQVPSDVARAYETASPEQQRRVDDALRGRLRELTKTLPPVTEAPGVTQPPAVSQASPEIHPDVLKIRGLVPSDVDARAEYRDYLMKKH